MDRATAADATVVGRKQLVEFGSADLQNNLQGEARLS